MRKLLMAISFLIVSGVSYAATFRGYAQITNTLQPSTTGQYGIYVGTGTIINLNSSTMTVTNITASSGTVNGNLTIGGTGNVSFSTTSTNGIIATTGADSGAPGNVGAYASTITASNITLAQNTWTNVVSTTVAAGDWDFTGIAEINNNAATITAIPVVALSAFSGATTTDHVEGDNQFNVGISSGITQSAQSFETGIVSNWRVSFSGAAKTIYLKVKASYGSGNNMLAVGRMSARRPR